MIKTNLGICFSNKESKQQMKQVGPFKLVKINNAKVIKQGNNLWKNFWELKQASKARYNHLRPSGLSTSIQWIRYPMSYQEWDMWIHG